MSEEIEIRPEVKAVFRRAAKRIKRWGWCQGRMVDQSTGAVCALGAIYGARLGDGRGHRYVEKTTLAREAESILWFDLAQPPSWWNDHTRRAQDEVVAKLEELSR